VYRIGPAVRRLRYSENGIDSHPMTAIIGAYTRDGFVVAADGRRLNPTGQKITDEAQKIYMDSHPDFMFAVAWAGVRRLGTPSCGEFDFADETKRAIQQLQTSSYGSLDAFIRDVLFCVYANLMGCIGGIRVYPPKTPAEDGEIARCLFSGYFKGFPYFAACAFRHKNGDLIYPQIDFLSKLNASEIVIFSGPRSFAPIASESEVEAVERVECPA
jgi:hypothetical protein